jgi:phage-related protein
VISILKACRREVHEFPEEIRGDLADALARLDAGQALSMPLSRPMPSIGRGVHELRLKDRTGAYRVVYAVVATGTIYLLHGFRKKTGATPKRNIEIARKRLMEVRQ